MKTEPPWETLTLAQAMALPDLAKGKAIYFLWRQQDLLYIGASTQVMERINRQAQFSKFGQWGSNTSAAKPRIPFDKATILKCETVSDMAEIEKLLIRRWMPPFNDRIDDGDQVWSPHIAAENGDAGR